MALLICLTFALRLANLDNVSSRTPDERVYSRQAVVWLESGPAGLHRMVAEYKADPTTRLYPPPTRVGMIRIVAALMQWTGRTDDGTGALLSCFASTLSVAVVALTGLRFFPPWVTVFAVLFQSVSPVTLSISRRTSTDSMVELLGILMLYVACEITRSPRRASWYLAFASLGALGTTLKESTPLPLGLCCIWILWVLAIEHRDWRSVAKFLGAVTVAMALSVYWLATSVGSLADLFNIVMAIPGVNARNAYALEYASGPPHLLLYALWIVSPVTALFSLAGLYAVFFRGADLGPNVRPIRWIAAFTLAHLVIAMVMPHWLNLRYIAVTFGAFYLFGGLGFWLLSSLCFRWFRNVDWRLIAAICVVLAANVAVSDYVRFRRMFVRDALADLSIKMLLDEQYR